MNQYESNKRDILSIFLIVVFAIRWFFDLPNWLDQTLFIGQGIIAGAILYIYIKNKQWGTLVFLGVTLVLLLVIEKLFNL